MLDDIRNLLEDQILPRAAELEIELRTAGLSGLARWAGQSLSIYRDLVVELKKVAEPVPVVSPAREG